MKKETSQFIVELLTLFSHADGMAAEEGRVTSEYIPYDPEMLLRVVTQGLQMEKEGKIVLAEDLRESLKVTRDDTKQYIKHIKKKASK